VFCPICKSEYRAGIRECPDCHAALVEYLPAAGSTSATAASNGMEILWTGTDPEFAGFLTEALDRAELQHTDDAVALGFLPAFPGKVFKISVRTGDGEAAKRVLQNLVNGDAMYPPTITADLARDAATLNPYRSLGRRVFSPPDKRAAPFESAGLFGSEPVSGPTPDDIVENFNPDQATCEVWSGNDGQMAQNIDACLRGVGIGCVVSESKENFHVCVEPSAESRAKEIVREIVEQTPPE
jgi:hypothetical protein